MARSRLRNLPDLRYLATPGAGIPVRVTPNAAQDRAVYEGGQIHIRVTAPPENGKANQAVRAILAQCMGVAPSTLTPTRGQTSRDKVFAYDP